MVKRGLDRRVQMSKSFLKEALISLLKEKMISQISVTQLCEVADVNRSTFYAHYSDIYDLLHEIENEIIEQLVESLHHYVEYDEDPIVMTEKLIQFIGSKHDTCEVLLSEHSNSTFEQKIRKVAHQFVLSDWKSMTITDERLIDYISAFIISGSMEVVKNWLYNGRDRTPKEIAQLINELAYNGMVY